MAKMFPSGSPAAPGVPVANYPGGEHTDYTPILFSKKVHKEFTETCVAMELTNNDLTF